MFHIIQNDPKVPPGNMLDALSVPYLIHHPYRGDKLPELEQIAALIVMGGAMGASDEQRYPFLGDLKQLIRKPVAARIPYLGICLGGQLLAAALGAKVVSGRWEELGTLPVQLTEEGTGDKLFRGIDMQFSTFQWHHDSFDIPEGGLLLASSAACPHQAFRVGECAWGLQFHPEVTEAIIRDWCAWDLSTQEKSDEFVALFKADSLEYQSVSLQLLENFLEVARLAR